MVLVDINVLIYAFRRDSAKHSEYRHWLEELCAAETKFAIPAMAVMGFLRIVTNPRIYRYPTKASTAFEFLTALFSSPSFFILQEDLQFFSTLRELTDAADVSGDRFPDAYLAALAIEHNATLMSADKGLSRYPGLRWRDPVS